jgi:chaperonin cofactor prefoldin
MLETHQQSGRHASHLHDQQERAIEQVQLLTQSVFTQVQSVQGELTLKIDEVEALKTDLDATFAIVIGLKDRLNKTPQPRISGGILARDGPSQEASRSDLRESMEGLKTRVLMLEAQVAAAGTVTVFRDIVPGI